ncbi:hypothetical protein P7C70_g6414, partial [Phenoliferia sp. Uapishka_3]
MSCEEFVIGPVLSSAAQRTDAWAHDSSPAAVVSKVRPHRAVFRSQNDYSPYHLGALHEGTTVGTYQTLAGVKTYVSLPPAGTPYAQDTAVVFLGDVFGFYPNALLIHARYYPEFDLTRWRESHGPERVRSALDPVLKYLRDAGITKLGATGYCFGGKFVSALAIENAIEAGVNAHPSGIIVPDDIEAWVAKSKTPLLFNSCEVDKSWPKDSQDTADKIMASYAPGWKQNYYPGCTHGFGTRADLSVPAQKHGKEDAFKESVEWFKNYLI